VIRRLLAAAATTVTPAVVTALVVAGPAGSPAVAAEHPVGVVGEVPGTGIAPPVAEIPVESPEYDAVADEVAAAEDRLAAAVAEVEATTAELDRLEEEAGRLEVEVADAQVEVDAAIARQDEARDAMQTAAVDAYVQAGAEPSPLVVAEPEEIDDAAARTALADLVRGHHADELAEATEEREDAEDRLERLEQEQAQVEADTTAAAEHLEEVSAERDAADQDRLDARVGLDDAWRTAMAVGSEIPLVAVDAYWRAAAATAEEDPACGLRWEALAGISRVEGRHGSFGASELLPEGVSSPPILGIALDGSRGTAVIGDTDGGALDGDPSVDRAVGPMQFIPSTWERWARDGSGDGEADPQNLYDAARSAAAYLCASGPGLDQDAGLRRAFFSYNHSQAYVERVLGFVHEYDGLGYDL